MAGFCFEGIPMEQIAEKIGAGLSGKSFEGSLKFDCGDDGVIVLADGTASTQDQTTDCTIKITHCLHKESKT